MQSTLKGQYTSRNEKLGSEKKYAFSTPFTCFFSSSNLLFTIDLSTLFSESTVSSFLPAYIDSQILEHRLFYGYWPDVPTHAENMHPRGLTTLVVEQVSHHPPITAYFIENKARGISLQGHNAQKTSFSGASTLTLSLYAQEAEGGGGHL